MMDKKHPGKPKGDNSQPTYIFNDFCILKSVTDYKQLMKTYQKLSNTLDNRGYSNGKCYL